MGPQFSGSAAELQPLPVAPTQGTPQKGRTQRMSWGEIEAELASGLPGYWYAIVPADEVPADRPLSVKRMGLDLAVWRDSEGGYHVVIDQCAHRGAKLTLGRVSENGLRCWYHGWLYDSEGRCIQIPSEGSACPFLHEIKLKSFPTEVHGGLIFTYFPHAGEPPREPCPNPYELESAEWSGFIVRHYWKDVCWFRALENLSDPLHAPYLHAGTYTLSRNKKDQDTIQVSRNEDGSYYIGRRGQSLVNFDYTEYHFPNWFRLDIPYPWSAGPGGPMRILVFVSPIDATSSQVYMVRKRKITGWKWWLWKALWHIRLERKMWQVINQDEAILLSQDNGHALNSEYLVQSDTGLVKLRNLFREALKEQCIATGRDRA
jgi:phenylpropionate dioxygenase-like ring-hydroxylating dioxygenase large terminal subunit